MFFLQGAGMPMHGGAACGFVQLTTGTGLQQQARHFQNSILWNEIPFMLYGQFLVCVNAVADNLCLCWHNEGDMVRYNDLLPRQSARGNSEMWYKLSRYGVIAQFAGKPAGLKGGL
ncbi:hypothetical protein [Devosia yakushimensis]|nr:hypothetical protein [Devosia yakushimensis]